MLDADLAGLYGTSARAFNQAVKRNRERFSMDFMFQLTADETEEMRSQIATSRKIVQARVLELRASPESGVTGLPRSGSRS
jgi:hypothetical protein